MTMTNPPGAEKTDPNAPLTVQELMEMRPRYTAHAAILNAINTALQRRLNVPAERR